MSPALTNNFTVYCISIEGLFITDQILKSLLSINSGRLYIAVNEPNSALNHIRVISEVCGVSPDLHQFSR